MNLKAGLVVLLLSLAPATSFAQYMTTMTTSLGQSMHITRP